MEQMNESDAKRIDPPDFPGGEQSLVTSTARSALSMTRFRRTIGPDREYLARMAAQDAWVVLFQLRSYPAHEFRIGRKVERVDAIPRATLNIVDLRDGEACGRLHASVDTLMIHIPRAAADDIADAAETPKTDGLSVPERWRTRDTVLDQLQPLLLDALGRPLAGDRLLYDHLLLGLGVHLVHRYGGSAAPAHRKLGVLAPWQERRAKEMLSADFRDTVSLGTIARECRVSPDHLSRAFKASTGVTPHQWLQAWRIEKAKTMLDGPHELAEIAQVCGFADQSHFSRTFARHTGSSPGRWRKTRAATTRSREDM
jgi:AraC-like DNA-binding protein